MRKREKTKENERKKEKDLNKLKIFAKSVDKVLLLWYHNQADSIGDNPCCNKFNIIFGGFDYVNIYGKTC